MSANVFEKRTEQKYLLSQTDYEKVTALLAGGFTADAYGWQNVHNLYFDDSANSLILESLQKPAFKEKLRLRGYGNITDNTPVYFEIKRKNNGIVYKRREILNYGSCLNGNWFKGLSQSQKGREILYLINSRALTAKLYLGYRRLAMYENRDASVRVTFDKDIVSRRSDLSLNAGRWGLPLEEAPDYIMEIKSVSGLPLKLSEQLSRLKIFPSGFSKYGKVFEYENTKSEVNLDYVQQYLIRRA